MAGSGNLEMIDTIPFKKVVPPGLTLSNVTQVLRAKGSPLRGSASQRLRG